MKINNPKQQIINDLNRICLATNEIPTKAYYEINGFVSTATVRKYFGTWNTAIKTAFGDIKNLPKTKSESIIHDCLNCGHQTTNPKFCSRSCSVSFSNSKKPKRNPNKQLKMCVLCRAVTISPSSNRTKCDNCNGMIKTDSGEYKYISQLTKKDYLSSNQKNTHARIRGNARQIARDFGKLTKCSVCGYSLHVDCAHIRPIASFSNSALISEINHPSNLIGLCKNHHWEQENGFLDISGLDGS